MSKEPKFNSIVLDPKLREKLMFQQADFYRSQGYSPEAAITMGIARVRLIEKMGGGVLLYDAHPKKK
jgi:hypothetical protein